ncbi:MAG: hypothetical protein J0L93_03605 [Deltaproteobacteria bacterium]|nr:hypothetical protein [Deltaproteobacteria bacterium]
MKYFIFLFVISVSLISCSSKMKGEHEALGDAKYYFSDIQIVSETIPEGSCSDDLKLTAQVDEPFKVEINENKELAVNTKSKKVNLYGANITLQVMGFDQAQYTFSAIDQMIPESIPFGMKLKRIPGNMLLLTFLDQNVEMKLQATPIYTFSATEQRKDCKLVHHVNVFGEKAGYYPLAK